MSDPILPYGTGPDASSGFAAGVGTSEDRARTADRDGTTSERQAKVMNLLGRPQAIRTGSPLVVERGGPMGLTWKELAEVTGWHHGQVSGVLSVLHKADRIARLTERRDRCYVYVLNEYVGDRETQPQGRPPKPCASDVCSQIEQWMVDAEHALSRVKRLHANDAWGSCSHCGVSAPCATIRAIEGSPDACP